MKNPAESKLPKDKSRAFAALEYALLFSIVVAALIGMAVYLKRGVCGKWRSIGDTFGYGRQYEPQVTREIK